MDFQNIYLQLAQTSSWSPDLKNTFQEWSAMFSTVNITLNELVIHCIFSIMDRINKLYMME